MEVCAPAGMPRYAGFRAYGGMPSSFLSSCQSVPPTSHHFQPLFYYGDGHLTHIYVACMAHLGLPGLWLYVWRYK